MVDVQVVHTYVKAWHAFATEVLPFLFDFSVPSLIYLAPAWTPKLTCTTWFLVLLGFLIFSLIARMSDPGMYLPLSWMTPHTSELALSSCLVGHWDASESHNVHQCFKHWSAFQNGAWPHKMVLFLLSVVFNYPFIHWYKHLNLPHPFTP